MSRPIIGKIATEIVSLQGNGPIGCNVLLSVSQDALQITQSNQVIFSVSTGGIANTIINGQPVTQPTPYHTCDPDLSQANFYVQNEWQGATIGPKRVYLGSSDQVDPAGWSDAQVQGGGIVLQGTADHFLLYDQSTMAWTSSESINLLNDMSLRIGGAKVLDQNKLKLGNRFQPGTIYMGSGEHNTWRITQDSNTSSMLFQYRNLQGQWKTQHIFSPSDEDLVGLQDPATGSNINYYIEKRGEVLTPLQPSYDSSNTGQLYVPLRMSSDDVIVGGRIMKGACVYNGTYPGPLIKIRPGDTFTVDLQNDLDDYGDIAGWNMGPYPEKDKALHIQFQDNDKQSLLWMAHPMKRGMTNLHFHGVHANPLFLGDNVVNTCKPGSGLHHEYIIPKNHPGGLYFLHDHAHGESMNQVSRGAAALLLMEGPYQKRVNDAGITRQVVAFQRVNYKLDSTYDRLTWWDYTAALPTSIYNPDGNGVPQALDPFVPEDKSARYKFQTDYGVAGGCSCGYGAITQYNIMGASNDYGPATACPTLNVEAMYLLNGHIQPTFTIQPGELQVWDFINASGITFNRLRVEGHDIVLVGKDGVPRNIETPNLTSSPYDPDWVQVTPGIRLNYLCTYSAGRFEFFLLPKTGVAPAAGSNYTIWCDPIDQTELFYNVSTNSSNNTLTPYSGCNITTSGGAYEAPVQIGTLAYSGSAISSSASNHINNLLNFNILPNPASNVDGAIETSNVGVYASLTTYGAIPTMNYKHMSYVFPSDYPSYATDWKQSFVVSTISSYTDPVSGSNYPFFTCSSNVADNSNAPRLTTFDRLRNPPKVTISGTTNYNGTYEVNYTDNMWGFALNTPYVADETGGTALYKFYTPETHSIQITTVSATTNPTITTLEPHRLVAGNPITINGTQYTVATRVSYSSFTITTSDDLTSAVGSNLSFITLNVQAEYFHLYNKYGVLPASFTDGSTVVSRRIVWFSFSQTIGNPVEGFTQVDSEDYIQNFRITSLLNTNEEWLMQNKTDVVHIFHIHVNDYQVCGYRDANFGMNINNNNPPPGQTKGYWDITNTWHPMNNTYRYGNNYLESDVHFNGYDDSTPIPVGQWDSSVGSTFADVGHTGEVRLRQTFADYVGLYYMHCHLLDDQDMGMMKFVEIVGVDPVSGNSYTPAPYPSMLTPAGYLTDIYNNPYVDPTLNAAGVAQYDDESQIGTLSYPA